jgi:hypothetical protein
MSQSLWIVSLLLGGMMGQMEGELPKDSVLNVLDFGAKPDGATDCTGAFQEALDKAGAANGGIVLAPVGRYSFDGSLNVPQSVTLRGVFSYSPAHAGVRDEGLQKPEYGTVFLPRANRGVEEAEPFIKLNANATLQGVSVFYPDQDPASVPAPYPYAIAMRDNNPAVIDVELLNPYKGIDASRNQRHLIRNVHGQPLRIGIYVDQIYDIGRIENVHWNPWWSMQPDLFRWQMDNGEAFVFGRTDWQYVLNTFCFGYHVGYKFIKTDAGFCNGNFLGIGADDCQTALVLEDCARFGILITNGEFVSFHGPDPTMIRVEESNTGSIRFNNCAFWGPCNRIGVIDGKGTVGFDGCTFTQWGHHGGNPHAIEAQGGSLLVRGCEFQQDKPQVLLGEGVRRAVITDNLHEGDLQVTNHSGGAVAIANNVGGE